jgi:endothelin-converting enzyme/putative endopeptidase
MVMGHELTHGFDDEGRQYDALGNLRDWWTQPASQEFDHRAACVSDQYDGYVAVDDVKLNGKLTLGENIADMGGVKLAHAAYLASRAGRPPDPPVAGFTPDQVFFLAFAQSWCTVRRPELARTYAAVDPHSPPRWRVNGPLSDLPDFAQAFSCPAGSAMVRTEARRCALW